MKYFTSAFFIFIFFVNSQAQQAPGARYKEIKIDSSYEHTKWGIGPTDLIYNFAAYTTSFDSDDDNNNDGISDLWGIPEWVAYEIKKDTGKITPKYTRPTWMTNDSLNALGKAPNDKTYAVSGVNDLKEVTSDSRYVRGHMCPKNTADRISMEAGFNTHTILNAVPQLQWENNGIWKSLENKSNDWADKYGRVWVNCGPVFFNKTPAVWLGQNNEVKAAIPDALFKIIIRETNNGIESLAFIIPNIIPKKNKNFKKYLTSISRIEDLTGLAFLTNLSVNVQSVEKPKHLNLTDSKKRKAVNKW